MPANTKRLDLRFGSFACSVQGFDDPVMPVQQVLRAIQHLLEETPELSDAGISFDAEAVESLVEEVARRAELASEDIEITPGLVIVHRGENDARARYPGAAAGSEDADATGGEREAWARPFTGGVDRGEDGGEDRGEDRGEDAAAGGDGKPAYVNIFAAQGAAGGEAGPPAEDGDDIDEGDLVAERLGRAFGGEPESGAAATAPAGRRDIFSESGAGGGGNGVFADPMAAAKAAPPEDDDDAPLNLFAGAGSPDNEAEASAERANLFASLDLRAGSTPDAGPDAGAGLGADPRADLGEDPEHARVQSLFGDTEAQPEPGMINDGFTVEGLVEAAEAKTPADLMVCAAAWLVLLKGNVSFTRREVLDVFDQIPGDHEKTLEARIKGFGRATRNGQLVMVEDGVFGLSQEELERFEKLL